MPNRKRLLLIATLVLGGIGFIAYQVATSPQWQQFRFSDFWNSLAEARRSYLLVAAVLVFASYFARCLRWRTFLHPLKVASLWNLFVSTVIGFSTVALVGRPGEVVRPWLIARKEGLPLPSQLGAWTLERVFDTMTLAGLLGAALWFSPSLAGSEGAAPVLMGHFRAAGVALFAGALLLAAFLAQLRYWPRFTATLLGWFLRPLPERYRKGLQKILEHFAATLAAIENSRSFLVCAADSLLVWLTLLGAFWSILRAFGEPMVHLSLSGVTLVMVAAVTGSLVHLPAIGGGTQLATILTLTELFGVPVAVATSAALMIWLLTYLLVLAPGLPLAAHEGLSWRGMRRMARSEA